MSKTQHVNLPRSVRVDEQVHEYLQEWADRERRSIANLIGIIIEDAVSAEQLRQTIVVSEEVIRGDIK